MDFNPGRWFQAQQVVGSKGETTTVLHEIWPSVSRQHVKAAKPSKKAPRKRWKLRSRPTLLRLQVELREIIFTQDLLEWTDSSLTPSLIVALRPHPQLYNEALDLFYALKACLISPRNVGKVLSMPKSVLKRVLSVDLDYIYWFQVASRVDIIRRTQLGTTCPPIDFLQQSKLRPLQLTVATVRGSSNKEILSLARYAVLKLPTLVNLTLRIPADFELWKKSLWSWSWKLVATVPVQMLNRGLGIPCKPIYDMMQSIDLHWDADTDGSKTLTWTDGEYWQSIKRDSIGLVHSRLTGCKKVNLRTQHLPGSTGFAKCLICPKQSCLCHDITPDPMTEGEAECLAAIAMVSAEGFALAESFMGIELGT